MPSRNGTFQKVPFRSSWFLHKSCEGQSRSDPPSDPFIDEVARVLLSEITWLWTLQHLARLEMKKPLVTCIF